MTRARVFTSADSGAPVLRGEVGALVEVLQACLVTGYGTVTLTSLVVADEVATATVDAGHNLTALDGVFMPTVAVAGATPSALNGDHVATILSSTQFSFPAAGIADQTATGTITAKRAAAEYWERSHVSGDGHRAIYRSTFPESTGLYLYVDDTVTQYPQVRGHETVTDIDTRGTAFPTAAQAANMTWPKSNAASSAARDWWLIAYPDRFWLLAKWHASNIGLDTFGFGDVTGAVAGDSYACALFAQEAAAPAFIGASLQLTVTSATSDRNGCWVARRADQSGGAVKLRVGSLAVGSRMGDSSHWTLPAGARVPVLTPLPITVGSELRGYLRDIGQPAAALPFSSGTVDVGIDGVPRLFIVAGQGGGDARAAWSLVSP